MIFVHSRKQTAQLAETLLGIAKKRGETALFARGNDSKAEAVSCRRCDVLSLIVLASANANRAS